MENQRLKHHGGLSMFPLRVPELNGVVGTQGRFRKPGIAVRSSPPQCAADGISVGRETREHALLAAWERRRVIRQSNGDIVPSSWGVVDDNFLFVAASSRDWFGVLGRKSQY